MIHEKSGGGLTDPGGCVEETHQQPKVNVGDAEVVAQKREERRQHQLKEVADEVGRAYEADDTDVPPETASCRCGRRRNREPPGKRIARPGPGARPA